jgi:hypothetical protein
MVDTLAAAGFDEVTSGVRKKLQKLLTALRQKAGQAVAASGKAKRERKLMKVIRKQLTKLDAVLRKARTKQQITPDLDSALSTGRQSAARALETFVTNVRR